MTVSDKENVAKEISKMAALARNMLGDDIPEELLLLLENNKQQSGSRIMLRKPTDHEKKFLDYWRNVRRAVF